jgi:OmpA-OmpF porin, OOP family
MKNSLWLSLMLLPIMCWAQPKVIDTTTKIKTQKENIVKESTIVEMENLGKLVNTQFDELRPVISGDGNLLFFIVENHPENEKAGSVNDSQDIWYSERGADGKWGTAQRMEYPLNTYYYNTVFWVSPDKNTLLLRNAFEDGRYAGNGLSLTHRKKNGTWSKPYALEINNFNNLNRGEMYGATMSHTGDALLFYFSTKPGSYNNDLFVSFIEADGTWSEPKGLGKKINLPKYNEMTPYLASDGVTLYFSSDRPGGLGDHDIWMSKRLDSTWENWSNPLPLKAPINTKGFDGFFTLDAGGEYAYLCTSNNTIGLNDIARVKLLEKEKPEPIVMVTGNVYNAKTKQPISASLVYQTLPDGKEAGRSTSNQQDGAFSVVLNYNYNYSIQAIADKFFAQSENLPLDSMVKVGYREIHKDLYLVPIEIGAVVRLNNVFFDFDKATLRPESTLELDRVVKLLNDNPAMEIELSAHTDSRGSDDYNFKLSDARAKSVLNYIVSQGIPISRLTSKGYGELKPVATNDTDEGRQENRRVEFTITKN